MDMKETLCQYLRAQRDAAMWKLEGVSERDLRMPMTPTGTNMLGLVKHLASIEAGYFGACLGREWPDPMPWLDEDAEANADMWATADESPEQIVELYRSVQSWADATIAELPLEAPAHVPWWQRPQTSLHALLVRVIAETARHAGHLDILRETIDGRGGMLPDATNLPDFDEAWWHDYVQRLRGIALRSADASG